MDTLIVLIATACTALVLLHAALSKLGARAQFQGHLVAYGVPSALIPALAWALPLAEAAAALALVTPWRPAAAAGAAALWSVYGAVMGWHVARGRVLDCGCGGEPLAVSWWLVARNAMLACTAAAAATSAAPSALGLSDFAVAACTVLLATLIYAAFNQVLRQQPAPRALSTPPGSST
jgi:hypothetical protein